MKILNIMIFYGDIDYLEILKYTGDFPNINIT